MNVFMTFLAKPLRLGLFIVVFLLAMSSAQSATLTWDANGTTSPNPSDGSGNWLTANNWWNSSAGVNSNGNWTATTPDSAVFGAGLAGAYVINLGGNSLYASNVTFNMSGYVLTNGMITLSANSGINVAANQTATVDTTAYGGNVLQSWNIGANAMLNMGGNVQGMQVTWQGGGTVNLTGINTPSIFWANTTVNQTSGSVTPGVYSFIGYSGGPGIYTLNGASASLNVNGGVLTIGRAGQSGTLTIQNGTVNVGTTAVQSLNLALDNNNNNSATVNVQGGTLNVGAPGIPSLIQLMPGGSSSAESAALNISGGTVNAQGIQFGSANAYSGGTARLTLTNGALYVGSSGILKGVNIPGTSIITLSGGLVGASANWSSAMPMTLATANGNVTFQAANSLNVPQNITLSGSLSGDGGLNKTGGGTLTLSGVNGYSGSTTINAGILAVTTASSGAGAYSVGNDATLNLQAVSAEASLNMSSLTLNAGSTLNLNLNSFGNPTVPLINVNGALISASTVTINLVGATLGAGQFPLIKYGSLGGSGFGAFAAGTFTLPTGVSGSVSLVNNTANQSIDLNVTIASLIWDGTINGNWDIGGTANWKTNAYYTESNSIGPAVIFDDTASGPNTAIVLNTMVAPFSVVANNDVLTYSISGPGGVGGTSGLMKQGSGTLVLGGNNTYTGRTTITGGKLALSGSGSLSNTLAIEVNGGATFDVSGLASTFALGSSQTLSNSASTGTINGNFNTGSGTVSLTYSPGTPSLNVTNGTLTLAPGTAFKINNTGASLAPGSYKIISKSAAGNAGFVAGTVPAVTVFGGGTTFGTTPSLQISNNELDLNVSFNVVDAATLTNKIMAGYQGWFRTPDDRSGNTGWSHWFNLNPPSAATNNLGFDAWPDTSELTPAEKYVVPGFTNADGSQAYLYSAQNYQTVLRHFQWLQTAGIDGVWLSQFCSHMPGGANQSDYPNVTNVMNNVRNAATATGRTWAFMYDFSGLNTNNVVTVISNQWVNMVNSGITSDARYLHHKGQPVLLLWGFFPDRIWSQPQYCKPLIDFLQAPGPYQAAVVGGGAQNWRSTGTTDFIAMLMSLTAWQPWQVGHYTSGGATAITSSWAADQTMCNNSNVLFIPVLFAGTHIAGPPPIPPQLPNAPRRNGNFLWEQFVAASQLNINSAFVAMFDEVNEGTEIMKVSNTPPTNAAFITFEGATSDWYLRLCGLGEAMLRSGTPITATIPISPFATNLFYKIINRSTGLVLNNQGSLFSGSPITQYANNNADANLHWRLIYDGAGYFTIKSQSSGKVIGNGGFTSDGSPVIQSDDLNTDDNKWQLLWDGTSCCRIRSKNGGKALTGGGATTNFASVVQTTDASSDNLRWQILQDDSITLIKPPPEVNFTWTSGNGITFNLSWPSSSTVFLVESAANLAAPIVWSPVTNTVIMLGGSNSVTIMPIGDNHFFRLRLP